MVNKLGGRRDDFLIDFVGSAVVGQEEPPAAAASSSFELKELSVGRFRRKLLRLPQEESLLLLDILQEQRKLGGGS